MNTRIWVIHTRRVSMSSCTFFGHRDCPSSVKTKLRDTLIRLIEEHAVDMFYVGRQGAFDRLVRSVLKELESLYPHIRYAVVLERLPVKEDDSILLDYSDTILPEGGETVHPRFAILWRNNWMLRQSDYVVTYITHPCGGASLFAEKAKRQRKFVINLK